MVHETVPIRARGSGAGGAAGGALGDRERIRAREREGREGLRRWPEPSGGAARGHNLSSRAIFRREYPNFFSFFQPSERISASPAMRHQCATLCTVMLHLNRCAGWLFRDDRDSVSLSAKTVSHWADFNAVSGHKVTQECAMWRIARWSAISCLAQCSRISWPLCEAGRTPGVVRSGRLRDAARVGPL